MARVASMRVRWRRVKIGKSLHGKKIYRVEADTSAFSRTTPTSTTQRHRPNTPELPKYTQYPPETRIYRTSPLFIYLQPAAGTRQYSLTKAQYATTKDTYPFIQVSVNKQPRRRLESKLDNNLVTSVPIQINIQFEVPRLF